MDDALVDNTADSRFELHRDGAVVSFATYSRRGGVVTIPHVETMPEHRGHGRAGELMAGVLDRVRAEGLRLRPLCPYAADYVRQRPTEHDLLAD